MAIAIVEMPKGTMYKYESKGKSLILDRVVDQPVPYNYGFIPDTLCGDGDALDVFIYSAESIPPLTQVNIEVLAVIQGLDNGLEDDKIIATIVNDSFSNDSVFGIVQDCSEYLRTYKQGYVIQNVLYDEDAIKVLEKAKDNYNVNGPYILTY